MAANKGKQFLLKRDSDGAGTYVTVGALRTLSLTINNEQIDVTTKDGDYWRKMIAGGVQSMSVSGAGIMDNSAQMIIVRTDAVANTLRNYRLYNEDGDYFQAECQITSYGESGEYNGAHEYTITLESTGTVTYTDV